IIAEAIRHKQEILDKIKSYSFDAYAKMVVLDRSKDSANILMIVESQTESHWESPNKYKEIILARKQSANIEGAGNMLGIGGLMNFNQNRLDFGENLVVSPTAKDAMDFYNYYLLDTLYIDSQVVFHLEIEPKSNTKPLFIGTIDIADSSYEVVGVDVGFNEGFDMPIIDSLTYSQRYAEFENNFWMPIEIRAKGNANIPFPGIPPIAFTYIGTPYDYSLNLVHEDDTFDEFIMEVDKNADAVDSAQWFAGQIVPLTEKEESGYNRIDSLENAPQPMLKKALMLPLGVLAVTMFAEDIFHFNRVEGAYLGGVMNKPDIFPGFDLDIKSGWAFKGEIWQNSVEADYYLSDKRRRNISFGYHKEVSKRPIIMPGGGQNATLLTLYDKTDPNDYFLEEGYFLRFSTRMLPKVSISTTYSDFLQNSLVNSTEFSLFYKNREYRENPAINDGRLRSLAVETVWDTRPLMKDKNRIMKIDVSNYTVFRAGFEYAVPDFISSDFHYKRYYASIYQNMRLFGLGQSEIYLSGGLSDGNLPTQRSFMIDHSGYIFSSPVSFKTVGENNFEGYKAGAMYIHHDFGRNLFEWSHIPLIKDIPFSLGIHGGAFWTDYDNDNSVQTGAYHGVAEKAFSEIGFSIGRITALRYRLYFTWQLSDYDTDKFAITIGGDLF
ncbi:MAG: hypothetical protein GY865_07125, partial [candidate division Zixibacteria bacterium]|nr:hypothetical protein [candidate division Zixibacteria bacterium]